MIEATNKILLEAKQKLQQKIAENKAELANLKNALKEIDSLLKGSDSDSSKHTPKFTIKDSVQKAPAYRGAITTLIKGLFDESPNTLWSPKEISINIDNWISQGKLSIKGKNTLVSAYTALRKFYDSNYIDKVNQNGEILYKKKQNAISLVDTQKLEDKNEDNETFLEKITRILQEKNEPMNTSELQAEMEKNSNKKWTKKNFRVSLSINYKKPKSKIAQVVYENYPLIHRYLYVLKEWLNDSGTLKDNYIASTKKRAFHHLEDSLFKHSQN